MRFYDTTPVPSNERTTPERLRALLAQVLAARGQLDALTRGNPDRRWLLLRDRVVEHEEQLRSLIAGHEGKAA